MDSSVKSPLQFHSFGCKVNTYDTGLLQNKLSPVSDQKIHIINTCAVTQEATKEAVKLIKKIKKTDPDCKVVVTGCAAQVDTNQFQSLEQADLVVANSHKGQLQNIIQNHLYNKTEKVFKSNIFKKDDLEEGGGIESSHTRAFLKIQDGCNSFCSYCIIPYARGKSRSLSVNEICRRINELYDQGIRETVLTGIHIRDFEDDNYQLEDLIEQVLLNTKMPRLRISSVEPLEIGERMLSLFTDKRLCPHFHLSIQSANDKVLKDMKRKYQQKDVVELFNLIDKKVPNSYVGMDVIVGFPTESEGDFLDTLNVLEHTPWTKIHVFPYSERPGTRATILLNQVSDMQKKTRAQVLRKLSQERILQQAKKQIGTKKEIIVLGQSQKYHGLSNDYWSTFVQGAEGFVSSWSGNLVQIKVTGVQSEVTSKLNQDPILIAEVSL